MSINSLLPYPIKCTETTKSRKQCKALMCDISISPGMNGDVVTCACSKHTRMANPYILEEFLHPKSFISICKELMESGVSADNIAAFCFRIANTQIPNGRVQLNKLKLKKFKEQCIELGVTKISTPLELMKWGSHAELIEVLKDEVI